MKKLVISALCLSVSIFFLGCNQQTATPDAETETAAITESVSETPVEESSTAADSEKTVTKNLTITVFNNCKTDIGMFSVIDPVTKEQINLDALANEEAISFEAEWPVEIDTFQWAVYNTDGDLYMEGETDISSAKTAVNLLLTGDGAIDDVKESFE